MGCIARIFYDFTGSARRRLLALFPYTRTVLLSAVLFVAGAGPDHPAHQALPPGRAPPAGGPGNRVPHGRHRAAALPLGLHHLRLHAAGPCGQQALQSRLRRIRGIAPCDSREDFLSGFTVSYLAETKAILDALDAGQLDLVAEGLGGGARRPAGGCSSSASAARPATPATRSTTSARSAASRPTRRRTTSRELTARVNDEGWDTTFADWLQGSRLAPGDGLLVFSVGGGDREKNVSTNMVARARARRRRWRRASSASSAATAASPRRLRRCLRGHPAADPRAHHAAHRGAVRRALAPAGHATLR